jgi:methyl-accepting chemotaxis protein
MNMTNSNKKDGMLAKFNALKLKVKFMLVLALMLATFIIVGFVGNQSYNKVIINGDTYGEIISNKDLVADILPPPAYLLESYQVALEMLTLKNEPLQPLVDKSNALTEDFNKRTAHWEANLTNPKMIEILNTQVKASGLEFIRIRDEIFIPSVRSADPKAINSALSQLKAAYAKHRSGIDELSKLAVDESANIEATVGSKISTTKLVLVGMILMASAFTFGVLMYLLKTITNPLNKVISIFGEIENGKFDSVIDVTGNDELSQVLNELDGMRTKLVENISKQQIISEQVKDQAIAFQSQLNAISKSTGMLVMDPEGNVLDTNDLFLNSFGYAKDELVGKNHEIFVQHEGVDKKQNDEIWDKLRRGMSAAAQIKRFSKEGKEIWLDVTYNPILSADGTNKVLQVVNYYRDVTEQKIKDIDIEGQLNAIGRSQGVIELDLEGYIIKVNKTYCDMLGYQEKDLLDQHVSMLLEPTFANSHAYKDLWNKLVNGAVDSGQYKRIGKGGKEVWIQASYNPIKNENGKIIKIVNYTIDITEEKLTASDNMSQIAAINKIQGVIEFDMAGKIIAVNENFAAVTGYSKEEILGNHHSMFLDATYKASAEYKKFWEDLVNGNANEGRFRRLGKGGKEIWLQAFYSPILDLNGNPYKVIKLATEITEQYKAAHALEVAVQESQSVIEGAKAGDLTSRVSLEGKTGAIASLCDGINALMDKMTEVIAQVREAGETINTAANEIATGNNDLSSRTEQQASSLEETASSMEELASTVKQNAENAKQANQLASAASGVAVKGGEVVGNVVTTMADINTSARKIEDIISVIDGIAFQTNILALNAAVEAARAGEQGRGFAVVAGEVRNLAQRSASAAKEIKELISDSVGKVQEGTKLVEDAGSTMHEIVSSVQRVTDIMGEISAASSEQSAGIDQVNNAITSMDEVTQQNAALVEQAAAAAESLVEQAASLMDTVGAFRLAGGGNAYANPSNSRSTKSADSLERRASNSPMRASAPATKSATKPSSKPVSSFTAKTGTDDGEWEEF